jgi:8-oxo-dGTP pyrophosphatase MutT (NUDIX family)
MSETKDFLLEEYKNLADCFWKNEQSGETRVNLFIGFAGAAIGGLVTLVSSEHSPAHGETLRLIVGASLSALIVLGIVTLFRMLKRNATTDGYKQGCDVIRQLFKDHFDDDHILLGYYPFAAARDKTKKPSEYRKIGGLTHTVAVINSLLLAGFAGAVFYPASHSGESFTAAAIIAAAAFFAGLAAQFVFVNRSEHQAKDRLRLSRPTHAGGVVYGLQEGVAQYLLVGPKKETPDEWLLPKGHIESGEGHGEAALREVCEETGVVASLICLVGYVEFEVPNKEEVRAKYYLMRPLHETTRTESRRLGWFAFDDALRLLNHPGDRQILALAERKRIERSQK